MICATTESDRLQLNLLRRVFKLSRCTPNDALYQLSGCMTLHFCLVKQQLSFLTHPLRRDPTSLLYEAILVAVENGRRVIQDHENAVIWPSFDV